ncbi:MAG: hydrogenase maturation protease [Desulfobulbaceae bacterium]|nr:hydrogenase maturation protease [Desulfobulbaceae bacterium]
MEKDEWVVLGIGNPYLQDDRAGVVVTERLEALGLPCRIEQLLTVGFEVLDKIRGASRAIIVDACKLGNPPGSILQVSVDDIFSSHHLVNSHAVTLGTTLKTGIICFPDEMPKELHIWLIEVKDISEFTQVMSPEVEQAVGEVVEGIQRLLTEQPL